MSVKNIPINTKMITIVSILILKNRINSVLCLFKHEHFINFCSFVFMTFMNFMFRSINVFLILISVLTSLSHLEAGHVITGNLFSY